MIKKFSLVGVLALLSGCASTPAPGTIDTAAVHRNLLVLDTHLDTPINFGRSGWDFSARHSLENDIAQVDLGRMADGNLDGGFFVIYTEQGALSAEGYRDALAFARARSETIDREIDKFPSLIGKATSVVDAKKLSTAGKLIAFKSIENSYPLGEDLSLLEEFYRNGVRMAGPVHSGTNQFADSATDEPKWNGLSPLGRKWVTEMNRLGMVIDASHSSDATFDQLIELSRTPVILSHSSPRWAFDHPRNLDDKRIRRLAEAGGAMCMSTIFMSSMKMSAERARLFERYEHIADLTVAEQSELVLQWRRLDQTEPMWATSFDEYIAALLHLIIVAGVDHVCFGADWDGGGGIDGLRDISGLPLITERLLAEGYTADQIEKMTSGNVLRLLRAAELAKKN
ncbi:dipeptidase [Parasphingorhabdus sp.]|uniref:dipeptidase n=1 Tax=Parasphingorhabdus sp. TaxID=2709688 RepID=UPI003A940D24